jgi:RNA polymerase sigma factor (sigma-70 family)
MPGESSRQVLRQLNTLFQCGVAGPLSDEELLEQFVAGTQESAEAAFTALVDRHGAMVLGVCRRVLGNRHAAEDAFQATFLVLARKAPEIARRELFVSWLYGVARRAAMDARARTARQHAKEKRLRIMSSTESIDEIQASELRSILDEELGRLPERHRAAIVLCELEGLSRREAAGRLGVSEGTLSSRLARAKTRLRERLSRRGVAFSAATLTSALIQDAQAVTVPPSLVDSTIRVATMVATGHSLAGVASTSVVTLTEGVLKAMLLSKLKLAFLGLLTVALVTTGAGVVAQDRPSDNDRLKNLERKVDRLLEVLGGSNRRPKAAYPAPDSSQEPSATAPAPASIPAPPTAPAEIAAVPQPPLPPTTSSSLGSTPFPTPTPMVAHAAPPAEPQAAPPVITLPAHPGQPNSLARRVDSFELRLNKLEQRLAEFERRLGGINSGMTPSEVPRHAIRLPATAPAPAAAGIPGPEALPPPPGVSAPATAPVGTAQPGPATEPPPAQAGDITSGEQVPEPSPTAPVESTPEY